MSEIYNFSAGPAVLPREVLQMAASEMLDWHGSGQSVMEMSHRGKEYMAIHAQAEADFRELLAVPASYKVLFLQGGATQQFAQVPMNLMPEGGCADYVNTGEWSKKAIKEGKLYGRINIAASSEDKNFTYIPDVSAWKLDPKASYVHICSNETIGGVEFQQAPDVGSVPLVADMSSSFLSRPVDVSRYGVIYGGAQKNMGPAGLTVVIIRQDLIGHARAGTASMLDYKTAADNDSMFNTPPTYAIYIAGLVFQWLKKQGGVAGIAERNIAKARLLYDYLDQSKFYRTPVERTVRSRMNVPFTLANEALDDMFLKGAAARGLLQLKGHRSVGGMRASIYNAMPIEGVRVLVDYMKEFEAKNG